MLGEDLPLIDDEVTIEQLLSHRSGIGDYLDENTDLDVADYLMPVPVHELATTEDYLKSTAGLRAHQADSPLGKLDGYEWVLLIAAHSDRHTKQMMEVKADPNFPKS